MSWPKANGIYSIAINNKKYIGHTICNGGVKRRWYTHRSLLERNKHPNRYLQSSYNKYGSDCVVFDILEICSDYEQILSRENFYITEYKTLNREFGYNLDLVLENGKREKSAETRAKLSLAVKGKKRKPLSDITKNKISLANRGRVITTERREKQRKAKSGVVFPTQLRHCNCGGSFLIAYANSKRLLCNKCKGKRDRAKNVGFRGEQLKIYKRNWYLKNKSSYIMKSITGTDTSK